MSKFPVVQIEGCAAHENSFHHNGKVWVVTNLIARADGLEPFDLPLAAIHLATDVWAPETSPYGMAHHMRRALDVDTSRAVILSEEGFIMDGWHRVLRALIDGKAAIKAVRFAKTPPHDYMESPA